MTEVRFDGRVAIVTGAGRGIGLAHAKLLAARGASVVVNDIGGAMAGGGQDSTPAMQAVAAIRAEGGTAVADTSDIANRDGARQLVAKAIETFGRVDVLVNNAGIYTMDDFPNLEWADVGQQLDVHVGGSFNVTRACWPYMVTAGYGRVVMTTSTGALGSANLTAYGTAKAGVLGLGRALAMVGEPLGIKVNVVAPMAMTRMMSAGMGVGSEPPRDDERDPSLVSPLVAILCHESCPDTGETYLSGMRRYARIFIAETQGYVHPDLAVTPEALLENWAAIDDLDTPHLVPDTMSWSAINEHHIKAGSHDD
ncbi:MAG: putative short-chain type dehydrogenase/reductase [Frankiales bacterium]|nr:putative short-chain type dehydrogenase/reductase [Frankiales bacterium]